MSNPTFHSHYSTPERHQLQYFYYHYDLLALKVWNGLGGKLTLDLELGCECTLEH
jgi:hypothetical protein